MGDIEKKAHIAAEKEYSSYVGKDYSILAEKCVDYRNQLTIFLQETANKEELSEAELYKYYYISRMVDVLEFALASGMLKSLNYEQDKNGLWGKKKKGLFR